MAQTILGELSCLDSSKRLKISSTSHHHNINALKSHQNTQQIKKFLSTLSQNQSMTTLKLALQDSKQEQKIKSFLKRKFQRERSIINSQKMQNGDQTYSAPPNNFVESLDPMARHEEFIGGSMNLSSNGIDNLNILTSSSYKSTSPLFRAQQQNQSMKDSRASDDENFAISKTSYRRILDNVGKLIDPSSNGIKIGSDQELHKLMDFMRNQNDLSIRAHLLRLLKNTPSQNNRNMLFSKFVEFDGLDILAKWLNQGSERRLDNSFYKILFDVLQQIPITSQKTKSSKLGKIVRKLRDMQTDPKVKQKLNKILNKWKSKIQNEKSMPNQFLYANKRQSQPSSSSSSLSTSNRIVSHSQNNEHNHKLGVGVVVGGGSTSASHLSQNTTKRYKKSDANQSSSSLLLQSAMHHHQQSKKKKKKKTVRFCDSDNLERVKFFRREDPPNMRNLTQPEIQQAQKQAILNPHRMSSEQLRQLQIDRGDALKQGFQHRMSNQKELKKMHAKIKWSMPVEYEFDQKYMLMDPSDSKQIEVQKLKVKNNFHGLIPANQAIINPAEAEVKRFLFTDKAIAKLNACTVIESDLEQAAKKQQDNRIKDLLLTLEGKSEEQVQQLLSDYQLQFSYEQFKILLNQTKQKHRVESSQTNSSSVQMQNNRQVMNGLSQQHHNNFVQYPTNSYIMPGINNNNGFIPQNFRNDKNNGHMTHNQMMMINGNNMYPNMMVDINTPMMNNNNNNSNPYYMNKLPQNGNNKTMMMMMMQDPQFQQRKSLQNILIKKKPPNYKTQPCRNFHSTSKCARGDACYFIHDYKYIGRPVPQQELNKFRGNITNSGSINIGQVPVIKFSEQLARENQANK